MRSSESDGSASLTVVLGWLFASFALLVASCADAEQRPAATTGPVESASGRAQGEHAPAGAPPDPAPLIEAAFVVSPGDEAGSEGYVCISVPIEGASLAPVGTITWRPPGGPVALHHGSLYAARGDIPQGPRPCDEVPELVATFGLYTPGSAPFTFPDGVAVELPAGTSHLYLVAHVLRFEEGPPEPIRVTLAPPARPVTHAARWVDVPAEVPPLYPHKQASSFGRCRFVREAHAVSIWPHMHRLGTRFRASIVRATGEREVLFEVPRWRYETQPIYPLEALIREGDAVETYCEWVNDGDETVLSGPFVGDEMCTQGLFVWPPESARCAD